LDNLVSATQANEGLIIVGEKKHAPNLAAALMCHYQLSPLAEEVSYPWEKDRSGMKLIAWQLTVIKNSQDICKVSPVPANPAQQFLPLESENFN
jgi:hypothetical protein